MPDLPVAGVALLVGIDRFMSEVHALTSIISNRVASIVVSIWENACNREVLHRELNRSDTGTERVLEGMGDIPVMPLAVRGTAHPSH